MPDGQGSHDRRSVSTKLTPGWIQLGAGGFFLGLRREPITSSRARSRRHLAAAREFGLPPRPAGVHLSCSRHFEHRSSVSLRRIVRDGVVNVRTKPDFRSCGGGGDPC
jgi:hypothetical protein